MDFDVDWGDGNPDEVVVTALAPLPIEVGWNIAIKIERIAGRVRYTELEIWSDSPEEHDLNGEVLRRLGLRPLQEQIQERLEMGDEVGDLVPASWFDNFLSTPRPGRKGRPLIEYALWARRYQRALVEAPRTPNKWLYEKYKPQVASPEAATQLVARARFKGMLKDTPKGVPGGALTDAAEELLKNVDEEDF